MSSAIESQIKDRIAQFVSELDLLVRKSTLEALQELLSGKGSAPVRATRRGRGPGRPRGSGRASGAQLDEAAEKVAAHVRANDGQGISAIAASTGLALPVAKKAAARLLASGQLKKSGQKRGTVYHVGSGKPARARKAKKGGKRRGRKARAA